MREGAGGESRGSKLPEARLARPPPPWPQRPPSRPGPAMIKAILIFNNHGKPRLSKFYQPYVSMPLPREPLGRGRAPAQGSAQRLPQNDPRAAAALPGVPTPRAAGWLAVSSGGGQPLPLPAGRSPSVGEAVVSPPRGALPTGPAPQPHAGAEPVGRPQRSSRRPVPLPVPRPRAQAGPGGLLSLSSADRWATVSALSLSELSKFGSPHGVASLSRVFPYGSIGSPV